VPGSFQAEHRAVQHVLHLLLVASRSEVHLVVGTSLLGIFMHTEVRRADLPWCCCVVLCRYCYCCASPGAAGPVPGQGLAQNPAGLHMQTRSSLHTACNSRLLMRYCS
jgi:hypothetical protein